jgi:hypothetical protein
MPPLRTFKLQNKPSALKREHPALQNMVDFYLFLWVIFALLDPDFESGSMTWSDPIRIRFWKTEKKGLRVGAIPVKFPPGCALTFPLM